MAVSELRAALSVARAASNVVQLRRPVGEGGTTAVSGASSEQSAVNTSRHQQDGANDPLTRHQSSTLTLRPPHLQQSHDVSPLVDLATLVSSPPNEDEEGDSNYQHGPLTAPVFRSIYIRL